MVTTVTVTLFSIRLHKKKRKMTKEDIKKIVDNKRVEQLTTQTCQNWEIATVRMKELIQELHANMNTCIEAEVYATIMRMQSAVSSLIELNKMPCAFLFSDYLNRIDQTVKNESIHQLVIELMKILKDRHSNQQQPTTLFDLISQSVAQHFELPKDKRKAAKEKALSSDYIIEICAKHLMPKDLTTAVQLIESIEEDNDTYEIETTEFLSNIRYSMESLIGGMKNSLVLMPLWLEVLILLPKFMVNIMQDSRKDSKKLALLFDKVLMRVRDSIDWWNYWKEHRETLRVVNDDSSWTDIMTAERSKERAELGKVPGGLFAKWTTDRKAFEKDFLDAQLSDDELRHFIFHLATLSEIARELDPTTKFGNEQLVKNELQQVGDAVMKAAQQLHDLTDTAWFPHYLNMWQELIENEDIFAHLKVTRKSPHNNLFTARFFCHLVGEMKKSAVFGAHSDNDLAEKLTAKRYVGTFRKNIQEGMNEEEEKLQNIFSSIFLKYNNLVHAKQ